MQATLALACTRLFDCLSIILGNICTVKEPELDLLVLISGHS